MLVAKGHKLYFYTHYFYEKHRNDIEMDFIISNNSKLKYKMYRVYTGIYDILFIRKKVTL